MLDNSNKESKLNKNIKVLNKSNNNNNSSSYSNSHSNSVYNKKKVINENNSNNGKNDETQENNFNKLGVSNSKSQNLLSIENLKKADINKNFKEGKLRSSIEQRENNFISNSNIILKKQKNTKRLLKMLKKHNKRAGMPANI